MIRFDAFSFWYPESEAPALQDVNLAVAEGELALVIGVTGSGKSTLLRAVNGLVPHFTGGHVEGRVGVGDLTPRDHPPRELAQTVGVVGQDPLAAFVTETVEEELAYSMEQLAVPPPVMRRRVEEVLDLMGIASLRRRALRSLSGGEQQRVALGSVLTASPRILVLDEPTSALDPAAAEDALAAVLRLVHDLGVTVLAAEHRLERVVEYADRLVVVDQRRVSDGAPRDVMRDAPLAPPVVSLGRWAGWEPLPLSVRDARRMAGELRDRLRGLEPKRSRPVPGNAADALVARAVSIRYGDRVAVREVDFDAAPGEVVALMGRNGSGKSSLLWALQGSGRRAAGSVMVAGRDPRDLSRSEAAGRIALVPQQAADLLYHDTVDSETAAADHAADVPNGTTLDLFRRIVGDEVDPHRHPRDLSDGQRLGLAIAVQLTADPRVLMLDEPTRGLDYRAKDRLRAILEDLARSGCAIVIATHDVEFVAHTAHRVVVMAEGEIVTDASVDEALAHSPVFAPQVAKVLAPEPWLTVEQVEVAVAEETIARG